MSNYINAKLFGSRLCVARKAKKLTAKELAKQAGITMRYVYDIENGLKVPKMDTVVHIANLLEITMDYLLQDCLTVNALVYCKTQTLSEMVQNLKPDDRHEILAMVEQYVTRRI